MQNTFHFVFRTPSLRKVTFILSKSFEILPGRPAFASLRNELKALDEIRCFCFPPYTEGVSPFVGNFWFVWNNWKQIFCERDFHQLNVAVSSASNQLEYCLTNQIFLHLLSDPGPIIVYPCQQLSHGLVENWMKWPTYIYTYISISGALAMQNMQDMQNRQNIPNMQNKQDMQNL